ncbi:MAG: LPXTG cell wall anchor domain-containing protein [Gemella haemolysans]|nr:LPXTG cell wall anchor domain-containing protein [Gemella haemolysans]MDU6573502.1 LPXTG cell wall anchor domain-containing protein [Gemella haemolysans]
MNLLSLSTLPNTGEAVKNYGAYIGIIIIIAVILFLIWRKKNNKDN